MSTNNSFHEVQFPTDFALGSSGGPIRQTEIITLGSGKEQRNARWAHSRRRYNAGYGIKTLADLQEVIEFFEERRGRLYGFRFRDPIDFKSSKGSSETTAIDQVIGTGDSVQKKFKLIKTYGKDEASYERQIHKPIIDSVKVSLNNAQISSENFSIDYTNGFIEFNADAIPGNGVKIKAGFQFDIPVRFDADEISVNLTHFEAGDIPSIPLVELLI